MAFGNYIYIRNKRFWVCGEPLNSYWEQIDNKPSLSSVNTCPLDKGYFAEWILLNKKLYLTEFYGSDFFCRKQYCFIDYFGEKYYPFFAFWFSDSIKIQEGDVIHNDHHFGDMKRYSFELKFSNGILLNTSMTENTWNHEYAPYKKD